MSEAVAVIDQNLAPGAGGITYAEIATALYPAPDHPPLFNVIGGLGGKDISGTTLASNVVTSSLTTVGALAVVNAAGSAVIDGGNPVGKSSTVKPDGALVSGG